VPSGLIVLETFPAAVVVTEQATSSPMSRKRSASWGSRHGPASTARRVHRPYATKPSRIVSGSRVSTARSIARIPGAVANVSLSVATTLEPIEVSHHSARSRLVSALSVGRPLGVRLGAWSGSVSRSGWRSTTDNVEPSTPTAHPAAGLSENA
jgi:hypothetical protein